MIKMTPLRRTIRHLAHRLRMEGETFINSFSLLAAVNDSQSSNYTGCFANRLYLSVACLVLLQDSQDERFSFGDGDRMFKMCRQRPVSRDNGPLIR
jgi:hypothetical protein